MRRPPLTVLIALGAVGILSLSVPRPALALTYYLSSDLGVHGVFHLCKYSNGVVYSFNALQLCPLQVQDNGPPGVGAGNLVGFKTGEYVDGMTKVCVYNVMGKLKSIRIGSVDMCPLSYNF